MQLEALDCVTGSFCKTSPNKALHHVGVAARISKSERKQMKKRVLMTMMLHKKMLKPNLFLVGVLQLCEEGDLVWFLQYLINQKDHSQSEHGNLQNLSLHFVSAGWQPVIASQAHCMM